MRDNVGPNTASRGTLTVNVSPTGFSLIYTEGESKQVHWDENCLVKLSNSFQTDFFVFK